ncbi:MULTISPECIES: AAA family ATPase [unclassified Microcoleus]|uniref:AAA family ATPase n=1 Tax=unclassified Microcoleus TaxID=2642155 RepID=UPI002FD586EB
MLATFLSYQMTEKLHESANSIVYRGRRIEDKQPLILKMIKETYPLPEKIALFKREYEITQNFNLPGVVNAYSLENDQHRWVMVLEDFGAKSLDQLIQARQFTLTEFLSLAIQVVNILGQLHQQHVIHKHINPSNIILNQITGQLKLIDFGISTALSRENSTFRNPNFLEGTLAYISPEQTGRMNRDIDYRTDFYSLGVTFYELLTGQLPFPSQDALELVHCHIARQPTPLQEHKPDIPPALSEIVLKLMSKNAEDRYQSAYGLKADLDKCLQQWQAKGQIDPFPLRQQDVSDKFQIPQKLYGREREINTLLTAFDRVSQGTSETMLVSGYSGIGKSALVQEIYKPITRQRGYFISGKFDQFQRNIPYASLIQAFRSLVLQLLMESEADIATWREKLLAALGFNGQVIIEVIPEVELIVGLQPAIPELPPAEAQNRFNLVFQNFIKVFTRQEHPLVLFLDDLQWADGASLKLIDLLMTAADSEYLFLIGAYRDNEVSTVHPLMLTLDEIEKAKVTVNRISLSPLGLPDITELINDIFHCKPATARYLAELVLTKTGGNPFFIGEFLKFLYAEALVIFNYEQGYWQWDLGQIKAQQITDNVVELMVNKIQKLPPQTRNVLKLATCIGNQFSLERLAIVYQKSLRETAIDLWVAISEGFILPLSDTYKLMQLDVKGLSERLRAEYKFAHDRIQQAVYSLITEADRPLVHLRVGQLLLRNTPATELEYKLFDIVNQLNLGQTLINQQTERVALADLNLQAGKKAKASAAYQPAFNYFKVGLALLDEDSWHRQYDLTLGLYVEAAEAAYLIADWQTMERLTNIVLQQVETLLDTVKVYDVRIRAYIAQNKPLEAVKTALQVLKLLGLPFPEQPSQAEVTLVIQETQSLLAERQIEKLIDLPVMTDPIKLAAMQIMTTVWSPAYVAVAEMVPLLACKQINFSLQYGNAPESAFAYANYGFLLSGMGDINTGYQLGKLAISILNQLNAKKYKAITYISYSFIQHFKEHLKDVVLTELEAYKSGVDTGDFIFAASAITGVGMISYLSGKELTLLEREIASYDRVVNQLKQESFLNWQRIYWQAILGWIGQSEDPTYLRGKVYDEEKMLPLHIETNDKSAMLHLYMNKLILYYTFQKLQLAVENAVKLETCMNQAATSFFAPPVYLYDSLARLAVFPSVIPSQQEYILNRVASNQEKMETWAKHAPMNYLHKFYLVEAERDRVLGNDKDAREYYDKAIILARENEYLNEEALAYELAGRFYLARNQNHVARHYLQDAHYAYQRWGAVAKVKDLEARYPQFLAIQSLSSTRTDTENNIINPITTTGSNSGEALDFAAVMKASQAISGEIVLEQLLNQVMKTVIENAGAQKGFLILDKGGNWAIEAEAAVECEIITIMQSIPVDSVDPATGIPLLSTAIVNYVARSHENVVLNNATDEGQFTRDSYITASQPKSILCTPLLNQGKLGGILYLQNNLAIGAFTSERVETLKIIAAQAAISIENATLYEKLEDYNRTLEQKVEDRTAQLAQANAEILVLNDRLKVENLRMSAELDVTRRLQQMILPQQQELESIEGLEIAAFMEPADEVGGDYYDVLNYGGKATIGIGDVTGHGLESGVLMIMAQTAIRTLLVHNETDPVKLLQTVNQTLFDNVERMNCGKNMSLSLLEYRQDNTLRLSGQHEEVIVVRSSGEVERIDTMDLGFPIALEADIADFIASTEIQLNSGDVVVLYTDGITEAFNMNEDQYGIEPLIEVVALNRGQSAAEIKQAVIDDVRRYIGEQKVFDDITLVVIKQK